LAREALAAERQQAESTLRALLSEEVEDMGHWVRQHATCVLVTTDKAAIAANALHLLSTPFPASLAAEIGPDWVWVSGQESAGWLVHAEMGCLVYVSGGAMYTDVEANADVDAFTQIARTLSWPGVRGAAPEGWVAKFQRALRSVGIGVAMSVLPAVDRQTGRGGSAPASPKA